MRSNRYGFYGDAVGEGVKALTRFAPNGIVLRNTLAGAAAKLYPTGNDFPTTAQWLADFANPGQGDYRLTANALSRRAGTDGKDLGVDFVELDAATSDRQRQQHRTAVAARSCGRSPRRMDS